MKKLTTAIVAATIALAAPAAPVFAQEADTVEATKPHIVCRLVVRSADRWKDQRYVVQRINKKNGWKTKKSIFVGKKRGLRMARNIRANDSNCVLR